MTEALAPVLGEGTVEALRQAIRGELIARGDAAYEDAIHIWNGMHDVRKPALPSAAPALRT